MDKCTVLVRTHSTTKGVFANNGMKVFTICSTLATFTSSPKAAVLEATFRVIGFTLLTIYRLTTSKTMRTLPLLVFGAYLPLGRL